MRLRRIPVKIKFILGIVAITAIATLSACSTAPKAVQIESLSISTQDFDDAYQYIAGNAQTSLVSNTGRNTIGTNSFGAVRPASTGFSYLSNYTFNSDGSVTQLSFTTPFNFDGEQASASAKVFIKNRLNNDALVTSRNAFDSYDLVQQGNAMKMIVEVQASTPTLDMTETQTSFTTTSYANMAEYNQLSTADSAQFRMTTSSQISFTITNKKTQNQASVNNGQFTITLNGSRQRNSQPTLSGTFSYELPFTVNYNNHRYTFTFKKDASAFGGSTRASLESTCDFLMDGKKIGTLTLNANGSVTGTDLNGITYTSDFNLHE